MSLDNLSSSCFVTKHVPDLSSDRTLPEGVRWPEGTKRKSWLQSWHQWGDEGVEEGVRGPPYFHPGDKGNNRGKTVCEKTKKTISCYLRMTQIPIGKITLAGQILSSTTASYSVCNGLCRTESLSQVHSVRINKNTSMCTIFSSCGCGGWCIHFWYLDIIVWASPF